MEKVETERDGLVESWQRGCDDVETYLTTDVGIELGGLAEQAGAVPRGRCTGKLPVDRNRNRNAHHAGTGRNWR